MRFSPYVIISQALLLAVLSFGILVGRVARAQDLAGQARGMAIAEELREQQPEVGFTNTAVLRQRDERGRRIEIPLVIQASVGEANWTIRYQAQLSSGQKEVLEVYFAIDSPPHYERWWIATDGEELNREKLKPGETSVPFAGSDFWICDLGLEFIHWEDQRWVRRERSNGRTCDAIDSLAPAGSVSLTNRADGSAGAYASVRSWVDADYRALLRAEAYNDDRILIKEFSVGSFKKVKTADGGDSWMLRDIRIRDARRDRRTELIYDLPE